MVIGFKWTKSLLKWDFIIAYYSKVLQLTFLFCFLMVLLVFFTNKCTHRESIVSKEFWFFLLWLVDKPTLQRQVLVDVQPMHNRYKLWWILDVNWYCHCLYLRLWQELHASDFYFVLEINFWMWFEMPEAWFF